MKRRLHSHPTLLNFDISRANGGSFVISSRERPPGFRKIINIASAIVLCIAFGAAIWILPLLKSKAESASPPFFQRAARAGDEIAVRVRYFTSTKKAEHPMPNEPLTLEAGGKSFAAVTDGKGVAQFKNVPCGKSVKLTFTGNPSREFTRNLGCAGQTARWQYHFNSFKEFNSLAIEQVK